MAKTKETNHTRAYVLIAGRYYPPVRRATTVKRGHELTKGQPLPELSPLVFRWLPIANDR